MTDRINDLGLQEALLDPELTGDPELRRESAEDARRLLGDPKNEGLGVMIADPKDGDTVYAEAGLIKDRTNPGSVISCVPETLHQYILGIPDEIFDLSFAELTKKIQPTISLQRLRFNFWHEMDRLHAHVGPYRTSRVIALNEVCIGVGDKAYFIRVLRADPYAAAWLFTRPATYEKALEGAHMMGLSRMEQILGQDPVDQNGRLDIRVAALQIKVFEMLDLRRKGAPKQSIEQKSVHLHGSVPAIPERVAAATPNELAALEREVKALEKKVSLPSGSAVGGFTPPEEEG